MEFDEERITRLLKICRLSNQNFVDIDEIENSITNDELKTLIDINNRDIQTMINKDPSNIEYNETVYNIFLLNMHLYEIAAKRDLRVKDFSFMRALSSILGYNLDNINEIKYKKTKYKRTKYLTKK